MLVSVFSMRWEKDRLEPSVPGRALPLRGARVYAVVWSHPAGRGRYGNPSDSLKYKGAIRARVGVTAVSQ